MFCTRRHFVRVVVVVAAVLAIFGWGAAPRLEAALPINGRVRFTDITDGTSTTILVAEDAARPAVWEMGKRIPEATRPGGAWSSPANPIAIRGGGGPTGPCAVNCTNDQELYGFHSGGANALFADGSVHLLRRGLDVGLLIALLTRAGGETVSLDAY